jgi:hypothetical protein
LHPNGAGQAPIRRGKSDAEGQGRVAYLSRETVKWLKVWREHTEVEMGAVFRRLIGRARIGGPLSPGSIAPIFKGVALWIGLPVRVVDQVSGHSTRVGATQDLAALDIDLAAITLAGGWKSTRRRRFALDFGKGEGRGSRRDNSIYRVIAGSERRLSPLAARGSTAEPPREWPAEGGMRRVLRALTWHRCGNG